MFHSYILLEHFKWFGRKEKMGICSTKTDSPKGTKTDSKLFFDSDDKILRVYGREYFKLLVHGYVGKNAFIWIPVGIINIILMFHGEYHIDFNSNILTNENDKINLMEMLCKEINKYNIKLNRIYSGINDGFSSKIYHNKCDYKGETITVIKSHLHTIFGGYAGIPWSRGNKYEDDPNAFLFQLHPNVSVFKHKYGNGLNAVFHSDEAFLVNFGGNDLEIYDGCDKFGGNVCHPKYYDIDKSYQLIGRKSSDDYGEFKVNNIEMFQIQYL